MRHKHPWSHREHKPPWERWHPDRKFPRWSKASRRQRGIFFFRFAGIFALMVLLVLGGMAVFAFLLSHLLEGGGRIAVWLGGCGLSLVLPLLAGAVAMRVFRGIATPLADVMSAADAVAEGDLSVRVPEPNHGPVDFRRLAQSFNRMTAELKRSDQHRRNLTADVAHELRTPLHIIQGNLEGILDGVYEPTPEQIDTLLDEFHLLTRLVEDLQTLSLAEAGQLTLRLEPVDVSELLTDAGTSFSGQMEAAGIDLQIETEGDAGSMTVTADAERLDQIISNLVANALRHTPPGGSITLGATHTHSGIRILVSDSGEGISPKDLPFIFDRFWRGDRARARSEGAGSGLGLAITRQLVQSHGGRISVATEPGQGTVFTIDLPLESARYIV